MPCTWCDKKVVVGETEQSKNNLFLYYCNMGDNKNVAFLDPQENLENKETGHKCLRLQYHSK